MKYNIFSILTPILGRFFHGCGFLADPDLEKKGWSRSGSRKKKNRSETLILTLKDLRKPVLIHLWFGNLTFLYLGEQDEKERKSGTESSRESSAEERVPSPSLSRAEWLYLGVRGHLYHCVLSGKDSLKFSSLPHLNSLMFSSLPHLNSLMFSSLPHLNSLMFSSLPHLKFDV